jgi:hypothetical protein
MLARFWAKLFPARFPRERRAWGRRSISRITFCEVIGLPEKTPARMVLCDLTQEGVGLLCQGSVEPGSFLAVHLEGAGGVARRVRARVVHATLSGEDWLLGCALLDRLRPDEMNSLID